MTDQLEQQQADRLVRTFDAMLNAKATLEELRKLRDSAGRDEGLQKAIRQLEAGISELEQYGQTSNRRQMAERSGR